MTPERLFTVRFARRETAAYVLWTADAATEFVADLRGYEAPPRHHADTPLREAAAGARPRSSIHAASSHERQ